MSTPALYATPLLHDLRGGCHQSGPDKELRTSTPDWIGGYGRGRYYGFRTRLDPRRSISTKPDPGFP